MIPMVASEEVSDFEHAQRMLIMSSFIYSHSEVRKLSSMGKSNIPFEILQTEFDFMTRKDIISGTEHSSRSFDCNANIGFSGMDFLYIVFRSIAREGFDVETNNKEKAKEAIARRAFVLKLVDTFLKEALADSLKPCSGHIGCICKKRGLHHVQCFFDRIQEQTESGEDGNSFHQVRDMLLGRRDDDIDRRTSSHRVRGQDTIWPQVVLQSLKSKTYFDRTILNDNIRTVWLNDHYDARECVYAIVVNRNDKSVTVVFRGTSNISNWKNNLMQKAVETSNPITEEYPGREERISFHKGFYKLLIQPRRDNGRRKYDEIADKAYEYGMELGEGFRLNVTGHSLGGSLATLFGFYASTDERFNQYGSVRVTSFGSPVFGRVSFAKAFLRQEKAGKLSHARCVLDKDCVPYKLPFCGKDLAHTGNRIKFSQKKGVPPKVSYPYVKRLEKWSSPSANLQNSVITKFFTSSSLVFSPTNVVRYHDLPAYWGALQNAVVLKKRRRSAAIRKLAIETWLSDGSLTGSEDFSSNTFLLEKACERGDFSLLQRCSLSEKQRVFQDQEKSAYLTNTKRRIDELRQLGYSDDAIQEWFPDTRPFLEGEKAAGVNEDCNYPTIMHCESIENDTSIMAC